MSEKLKVRFVITPCSADSKICFRCTFELLIYASKAWKIVLLPTAVVDVSLLPPSLFMYITYKTVTKRYISDYLS